MYICVYKNIYDSFYIKLSQSINPSVDEQTVCFQLLTIPDKSMTQANLLGKYYSHPLFTEHWL